MKKNISPCRTRVLQRGFSLLEVMVVLAILGIVTTFTIIGVTRANADMEVLNAAQTLQAHIERAVSDSKRRNARGTDRASIAVVSPNTYVVTADLNYDGVLESQSIKLPRGAIFQYTAGSPPKATIDWFGNVAEGGVDFIIRAASGQISVVTLSSIGDAGKDELAPVLPVVSSTVLPGDVRQTTSLVGNSVPNLDPSPTPSHTPLPICVLPQKPTEVLCRCLPGKVIDSDGRCKN